MYERNQYNYLSEREKQLFFLVAKGFTNKEIAEKIFVSVDTVKSHIQSIFKKLGLKHRSQLVIYAFIYDHIKWDEERGELLCQEK